MFKKVLALALISALILPITPATAQTSNRMIVTMVIASNNGKDFNLDNDAYRDKLLQLFSYSSYVQKDLKKLDLHVGSTEGLPLLEGYNLGLTLKEDAGDKIIVRAVISKGGKSYIDTELSIAKPGAFFMGGPKLSAGDLILILESGY